MGIDVTEEGKNLLVVLYTWRRSLRYHNKKWLNKKFYELSKSHRLIGVGIARPKISLNLFKDKKEE